MLVFKNIVSHSSYEIHKGFCNHVPSPVSYIIKTIGIDVDDKKTKIAKKIQHGKIALKHRVKKTSLFLYIKLERKRKCKQKIKETHYEYAESI